MELRYFASVLWRFKVLFLALIVASVNLGVVLLNQGAQQYRSVATLLVRPPTLTAGGSSYVEPERYIAAERRFLNSASFRERLTAAVPDVAGATFELLPQQNTDIVDVRATASTPEIAKLGANSFVTEYLKLLEARYSTSNAAEPKFVTDAPMRGITAS